MAGMLIRVFYELSKDSPMTAQSTKTGRSWVSKKRSCLVWRGTSFLDPPTAGLIVISSESSLT